MMAEGSHYVVFVESNTSGTGADFIFRARYLGLEPLLLTMGPDKYTAIGFPEVWTLSLRDNAPEAVLEALHSNGVSSTRIAGVMSSSDTGVETAARLAERLKLPGPGAQSVVTARNKYATRLSLRDSGLNPWYADAAEADIEGALAQFPDGIIAKPKSGTGSIGFTRIESFQDVTQLQPNQADLLLEEKVPGQEYSVEFIGRTCLGICKKGTNGRGLELGHEFPADIDVQLARDLEAAARQALSALELDQCAAHVELMYDSRDGSVKLIEVNPRLAGGRIPDLVRLSTNTDPVIEAIRTATEPEHMPVRPEHRRGAAIEFIVGRGCGQLQPRSVEHAWNSVGVVDLELYRHRILDMPDTAHGDFRDRIGHVTCLGSDSRAASVHAAIAARRISWSPTGTTEGDSEVGSESLSDWTRSHRTLSVGLVRGTDPNHEFFGNRLAANQVLAGEIVDLRRGKGTRTARKRWRNRLAEHYHTARRKLMGSDSIRAREFAPTGATPLPPERVTVGSLANASDHILDAGDNLDLFIFKGCGVAPARILDRATAPVLNIHGGWLPNYRGNHCYFYACYYEWSPHLIVGSTLHEVTAKIDDGELLDRSRIYASESATVEHAYCLGELVAFERFIRILQFPEGRWPNRASSVTRTVQDKEPKRPGRLYLTRHRYPHQELLAAVRTTGSRTNGRLERDKESSSKEGKLVGDE